MRHFKSIYTFMNQNHMTTHIHFILNQMFLFYYNLLYLVIIFLLKLYYFKNNHRLNVINNKIYLNIIDHKQLYFLDFENYKINSCLALQMINFINFVIINNMLHTVTDRLCFMLNYLNEVNYMLFYFVIINCSMKLHS